jgi:hypothetical protein
MSYDHGAGRYVGTIRPQCVTSVFYKIQAIDGLNHTTESDVRSYTVTPSPCYDFNADGMVDAGDIQQIANSWRCKCGHACYDLRYDVDADCDTDIVDIVLVSANWGESSVPAALPAYMYHQDQVDSTGIVHRFDLDLTQAGDQQTVMVGAGETVSGQIEWQAWSGAGNPNEIGQVLLIYSWEGTPPSEYDCLFSGIIGIYPGTRQVDSFSFNAPDAPGQYYIWAEKWAHYSCGQAAGSLTAMPPEEGAVGVVIVE